MKNSKVKSKVIAMLLTAACMAAPVIGMPVPAAAATPPPTDIAVPYNIAITSVRNSLTPNYSGNLQCYARTSVQAGYTAGVYVELQQYNGGWTAIKTWNKRAASSVSINEACDVDPNYNYRLYIIHSAYSGNTLIEVLHKYSS